MHEKSRKKTWRVNFSRNDDNTQGKLGATVIENLKGAGWGGGGVAANKVYYGEYANSEHKLKPQGRAHFPAQRLEFEPSVLSVWLVTPGCFCSRSSEGNNIDWNF